VTQDHPQPALFVEEAAQHLHVEWTMPVGTDPATIRAAVARARSASAPLRGPNLVWGFDPALWRHLEPTACPSDVASFAGVSGPAGRAPATQGTVWLWASGNAREKLWSTCADADAALGPVAADRRELSAYSAYDNRDPIGFIDGTENPRLDEAIDVAIYPAGVPGAGGTAVLVQKWVHDLTAFQALPLAEQEAVFGRSRCNSVEMDDDVKPATSHSSRNVIVGADGQERHIYRRNTPYATLAEAGTMFIGCTNDPARMDLMLARMFGTARDGLADALVRYSRAVTGSYYFVPSVDALDAAFGPIEPG
jgi:putative iron-dependent peroxidase